MSPPNHFSGGVSASLIAFIACSFESGAAYTPPSPVYRHCRGSRFSSVLDAGNSNDQEVSKPKPPHIGLSPLPFLRIQKRGRHYDVQTAITAFSSSHVNNRKATVELHAQIHFGDASYFQYFNDDEICSRYDRVLYELITEDKFLTPTTKTPNVKRLKSAQGNLNPIAPTQEDRATASQYGLQCQVDGIQYCKEGWIHADVTREEFLSWLEHGQDNQKSAKKGQSGAQRQPLWSLASTATAFPGAELFTSLLRPVTTTSSSASAALTRRLFTHLFLPGDAFSAWIRAALWLGVPSPELSIMLVDWSSLSHTGREARRHNELQNDVNRVTPISPIAAPVLLSLITGNWGTARRLIFGQVLVSGQFSADSSKQRVLIEKRNERAMDVLRETISLLDEDTEENETNSKSDRKRVALLYGAGHCRDLHRRLVQEENMTPMGTEWRTAFRATAPRWGDFLNVDHRKAKSSVASKLPSSSSNTAKTMSVPTLESAAVGLVILPLYLLVGGLDWASTIFELGNSVDGGLYLDAFAAILLYLLRHVALYVGISKFVVDWGGQEGMFEGDESE